MTTNPYYDHRRMMAAIKAISDGRQLDDFASMLSLCTAETAKRQMRPKE